MELAVTVVCKQLQVHAGELKLKLDAAGATVDYAAANASTVKGFAAAIREELSSIKSACENLQADSDLALVKAEASRQAAVKASSALPLIKRGSDSGSRDNIVRDLEVEKRRSHQLETQVLQLRDETVRMQHFTEKKEQELQTTLKTLRELWEKHEAASSELERLRHTAGSTVLGQGSSGGQMPSPPPFDRNQDRSSMNGRRSTKSSGGITPTAKTQLATFKVASLEEQMTRLQKRCDAAEERAERAEAELEDLRPPGANGDNSPSREVEKITAKLRQKDKELQSAMEKIEDLQWVQAKHKTLLEEFEKTKASEASLLSQLSVAMDQSRSQPYPVPDKTSSLSQMSGSHGGSLQFTMNQNPPSPQKSASMSRIVAQPPGSLTLPQLSGYPGLPLGSSSPKIALLDRNRHSHAGQGLASDSPVKTTLLSPPSPSVQINKMRGHGSSPGENGVGEGQQSQSLRVGTELRKEPSALRVGNELRKESSASSVVASSSSRLRPPRTTSSSPRSQFTRSSAPIYSSNIFGPPPDLQVALSSLKATLGKIDGLSAATEITSSDIIALIKAQGSSLIDGADPLYGVSGLPALDPLLRMMEASSEEFVQSVSSFAADASTTPAPSDQSAAISLRSLVSSSLSLIRTPCLFADVSAMAIACISTSMRIRSSSASRPLPSPCCQLLNDLKVESAISGLLKNLYTDLIDLK